MVLQGADGGHDDHSAGLETGHAALDVQELLCAQVCAEARLGHNIVAQLEGDAGGHDGVAAVGDVGEGAAVDKGRGTLQGLDQVGLEGILQQGGHGPGCLQIASGHRLVVVGIGHDHAAETFLQVGDGGSQTQHCHDLGGHGDVKAVLTGHALHPAAQAVHDVPQLAVVHVDTALPGDLLHVDPQGIALLNVVVQHRSQQVVGRADGVEVAGEVEVDVLHGHDLGVAAAGRAALEAEHGAERRLPQGHDGSFADLPQPVGQAHGGRGFPLSGRGGCDGSDQNELAVWTSVLFQEVIVYFCFVVAVLLQILLLDVCNLCNVADVLHGAALGDLNVGLQKYPLLSYAYRFYLLKRYVRPASRRAGAFTKGNY